MLRESGFVDGQAAELELRAVEQSFETSVDQKPWIERRRLFDRQREAHNRRQNRVKGQEKKGTYRIGDCSRILGSSVELPPAI